MYLLAGPMFQSLALACQQRWLISMAFWDNKKDSSEALLNWKYFLPFSFFCSWSSSWFVSAWVFLIFLKFIFVITRWILSFFICKIVSTFLMNYFCLCLVMTKQPDHNICTMTAFLFKHWPCANFSPKILVEPWARVQFKHPLCSCETGSTFFFGGILHGKRPHLWGISVYNDYIPFWHPGRRFLWKAQQEFHLGKSSGISSRIWAELRYLKAKIPM